ncbi:FAD-dependent monooxygenase [Streptomyces sp. NPDC058525]|uniref:FAD-dependent monooxygenase n=1 Tax=Streptomyces sp. NPDC058525 TaxID=3346538 RepID=UPI003654DED7
MLIVGGGIVGLSCALFLAHRSVPCILVERHEGTSVYPRFRGINVRTMELYRSVASALERDLLAIAEREDKSGLLGKGRTLADPDLVWMNTASGAVPQQLSPTSMCLADQDRVEPIVRRHAEHLGAQMRFHTELAGFDDGPDGVVARLRDRTTGEESTVRASYVIAADGAGSPVRQRLGITSHGPGHLSHRMALYFRADLSSVTPGRKVFAAFLDSVGGHLVRRDIDKGMWQLSAPYDPEHGERVEDFTPARCLEIIRTGVGQADLDAEIVGVLPWEIAARVADRYRSGRVFLAGDAAHVNGPWGGLGANTGVQDVHNLAWKLAAVHHGQAMDALLDTYDIERRSAADLVVGYAFRSMLQDVAPNTPLPPGPEIAFPEVVLGYCYRSAAVSGGPSAETVEPLVPSLPDPAPVENPLRPSGRPGTRAPHVVLEQASRPVSTIDLPGYGFTLLAALQADWAEAAVAIAADLALPVTLHRIGPGQDLGDPDDAWAQAFGLTPTGATLLRPDGFIAWTSPSSDDEPLTRFRTALTRLLGRTPQEHT